MASSPPLPDSEIPAKATRRRFTAAKKARILDAYEAASPIESTSDQATRRPCFFPTFSARAPHVWDASFTIQQSYARVREHDRPYFPKAPQR